MTTRTTKTPRKAKRPPGRPRRTDPPAYDAKALDRLLVQGEEGGNGRQFPSYQEAADRFGISKASVGRYAKEHNCLVRRREFVSALEEVTPPESADELGSELDAVLAYAEDGANARDGKLKRLDRIGERYLDIIEEALEEGRVRPDFADLERIERLRQAWKADDDERAGIPPGMPTLADLQRIHARNQERARTENAAVIGRLPIGSIPPSWVEANLDHLKSIVARLETKGGQRHRRVRG